MKNSRHAHTSVQNPFVLCGFHSVESAVVHDAKHVERVWLEKDKVQGSKRASKLINLLGKYHVHYSFVDKEFIERETGGGKHQGVAAKYTNTTQYNELHLYEIIKKGGCVFATT
jgi:tRNA G18 (ribose-2'-O)-methylase SpoU